jgi:hypothetical protein
MLPLLEISYIFSAHFTDTMRGSMKGLDGSLIASTKKMSHIAFCTDADWKNGESSKRNSFMTWSDC